MRFTIPQYSLKVSIPVLDMEGDTTERLSYYLAQGRAMVLEWAPIIAAIEKGLDVRESSAQPNTNSFGRPEGHGIGNDGERDDCVCRWCDPTRWGAEFADGSHWHYYLANDPSIVVERFAEAEVPESGRHAGRYEVIQSGSRFRVLDQYQDPVMAADRVNPRYWKTAEAACAWIASQK